MEENPKRVLILPCKLEDVELLATARDLAASLARVGQLEAQLESFKKQVGADIKKCEQEVARRREIIATGEEYRDVECEIIYHWLKGTKEIVRTDTGEHVRDEVIPEDERQKKLFDDKQAAKNAPAVQ